MKFRIKEYIGKSGTVYFEPQIKEFLWWRSLSKVDFLGAVRISKYIGLLGPITRASKKAAEDVISMYIDQEKQETKKKKERKEFKKKNPTIFHTFKEIPNE